MCPATPSAEFPIDAALVRRLLRAQHPDLAERPIEPCGEGWDNAMFRIGRDLAARLPRREATARLVAHEQRWLPELAPRLPLPVPKPVRLGVPGDAFPWPWSVVPWLAGETADRAPPSPSEADAFAAFLRALHQPAPEDAPENVVRGVPLARRRGVTEERLARLRRETREIPDAIDALWRAALEATPSTRHVWLHGDLHPRNVLVEDGRLSGVVDWGDVTGGDPACDLAGVFLLFASGEARERCLARYGADAPLRARAIGWAIVFAAVLLDTGRVDHPPHAAIGRATFERLAEEAR